MANVAPKEIYYYNVTIQANAQVLSLSRFEGVFFDPQPVRNPKTTNKIMLIYNMCTHL